MRRYAISEVYTTNGAEYRIYDLEGPQDANYDHPVVWARPITDADDEHDPFPPDVRAEYERLCGRGEFVHWGEPPSMPNLVELVADDDEGAWDQPCAFGHRVGGHAVYCHNDKWLYAPTKCRRSWYTGGEQRDEDCRGFKPNPLVGQKQ